MSPDHLLIVQIGTALALLALSVVVAGTGDGAADIMVVIWLTLGVLFAIHHFAPTGK